jgi:serine/threonine-protein kinase
VAADQQITWDVEREGKSIEVHAGSYRNGPVFFEVHAPWARPGRAESSRTPFVQKFGSGVFVIMAIGLELFCVFLAWRNIRLGRGDTRGALRVSFVLLAAQLIWVTLSSHYSSNIWWAWRWWQVTVGLCAGIGLQFWILYVALEPYIRRSWPEMLISWSRFLNGQFRDALVGRDVLLGILFGVLMLTAATLYEALPHWFSVKGVTPIFIGSPPIEEGLTFVGYLFNWLIDTLMYSIGGLTLLVILWRLTRSKAVAITVFCLVGIFIHLIGENLPVEFVSQLVRSVLVIVCLTRFGLLSLVFAVCTFNTLLYSPVTWDITRWYAGRGAVALLFVLALALYGFRTSVGGRPVLGVAFED